MGIEVPHGYDPVHERYTPRVSKEDTVESLTERIKALDVLYDSSRDEDEASQLAYDRSQLADMRNHLFPRETDK